MRFRREEVSKRIGVRTRRSLVDLVRLVQSDIVDEYLFIHDLDPVARKPDRSFHIMLCEIFRVFENNDITTFDVLERQYPVDERSARAKYKFVHEQMVADQKVVLH